MKNNILLFIIIAIVVGAAAFYGGMQYQKSQSPNQFRGQFRNGNNGQGGFQGRGNGGGMAPIRGEIMSTDESSVTVKMQDGSSKILILSGTTAINKASEGSKTDLKTGETITVFGTANADGSVTAQNIAIGGGTFAGTRRGDGQGQNAPSPTTGQ